MTLRTRIRFWLGIFIAGLVLSGLTAFPLETELRGFASWIHADANVATSGFAAWIVKVRDALADTNLKYPFLAYGTDWLAFAHLVIAVAFIGVWREPVRNVWVVEFGMIACAMVLPLAFIAGPIRGIPFYWQLIDCSFGLLGIIPLWFCRRTIKRMEDEER